MRYFALFNYHNHIFSAPTPVLALGLIVAASEIAVSWNPPLLPNGVVSYNVTLSGINLANNEAITISENSAIVDETSYTVAHSSIPYSNYTAIVFASTSAGDSGGETVTEQTPEEGMIFGWTLHITWPKLVLPVIILCSLI